MTLLCNNLRQVVHTLLPLSPSSIIWYQRKQGSKQAYHVVHQPVSRGLAVFADAWLSGWLAEISADLRENGSTLEVVPRRCAIQIHDFTLLYFTGQALTTLYVHDRFTGQALTTLYIYTTKSLHMQHTATSHTNKKWCTITILLSITLSADIHAFQVHSSQADAHARTCT